MKLERSVKELGMRALKLHPIHQAFHPNDTRFYPLYEKCVELNIPALFHLGYAGAGSDTPCGMRLKSKYSAPILCFDDMATSWGWEEQIAVAPHKGNVYMNLSGWFPRFISQAIIHECSRRLKHKMFFESDYPFIQPDRWLQKFQEWDLSDEIRSKVLLENAKTMLNIS
jgi:predicted TIM-barrel fold metal-dependent hydrolase